MAQWASTRPDVFPPRLIDKIVCLQDDVKVSHSLATVEHTLEEAFGPDWKNQLDLDPNPLGAGCNSSNEQPLITLMLLFYLGSVAQVFKGTLKPSNSTQQKAVAIKMIHPHVESMVKTDMELLSYIASIMDKVPSLEILSLGETMRQFADAMNNQLDLRLEARNLICELLFFFSFSRLLHFRFESVFYNTPLQLEDYELPSKLIVVVTNTCGHSLGTWIWCPSACPSCCRPAPFRPWASPSSPHRKTTARC